MNKTARRSLQIMAISTLVVLISGLFPAVLSTGVKAASSFMFISWADTKSAQDDLSTLSDQAVLLNPAFTIYPGDLESDGFTPGGMAEWKEAMDGQLTGDTAPNGMFDIAFPVRGNHDDRNTLNWQTYFDFQATANLVGATNYSNMPGEEDLTYSFDYENAHFIGVDVTGSASGISSIQITWIDADLTAAESRGLTHAFIFFHGPIYCVDGHCDCNTRTCSIDPDVEDLIDVLNQHPIVTATFHGHEHTYAYTYIDETRIPADGSFEGVTHPFHQFVTGSAGAGPTSCSPSLRCDYNMADRHGFVTVDVNGPNVTVTFYQQGSIDPVNTISFSNEAVATPTPTSSPTSTSTPTGTPTPLYQNTIRVPQDQPTIQAGINAAQDGDLVLVSPGLYSEQLTLANKTITLASQFYTTSDPIFIDQTVIDGDGKTVIVVDSTVGEDTKIIGFTIRNGEDGISASGKFHLLNNRIVDTSDGIDYEGGGGICRNNTFENNSDDGIDLDGPTEAIIENNIIRNNGDDGIEIRLHAYSGPTLNIIIRDNIISGNGEDGIQLIDYDDISDRIFFIEHNLIADSAMVGLGLMDKGDTSEDYRAASIPERIHLINNTFVNNPYSVTGGDNLIAINNLFVGSSNTALKNVDGGSISAYQLFWNNSADNDGSNLDMGSIISADPLFDLDYHLQEGSPAIDTGTAYFEWQSETILNLPGDAYFGDAPDLGTYESNYGAPVFTPTPSGTLTPTSTPTNTSTTAPTSQPGDIPLVDSVSSGTTAGSSIAISHTTSGSDRLMLVGVSINNDNLETVSSITYNGASLTRVGFVDHQGSGNDDSRVEIWKLINPPTSTHNVVITFNADLRYYAVGGVITFTGVDQADPLGTFTGDYADSSSASVTVPSASGELVLGVFSCETCTSVTFSPPAVEQWNLIAGGGKTIGAGATVEGVSSQVTINTSLGKSDHWAMGGISIKPASTVIATQTATAMSTHTPTSTSTPTATATPSNTFTPTVTATPSNTFTATVTPSDTPTPTDTFTPTVTATPTDTATPTSTSTSTSTPTDTPTPTDTFTPTVTATPSDTPTPTDTPTDTFTPTVTATPTSTPELPSIPQVDAISSGTTDVSSLAISHTTSGSDRLMLVGVSINNDNLETVSSITYNGASLTRVGFVDHQGSGGDDSRVEIWKLVGPPTGTHNVVITFNADLRHYAVGGVITFTGVDQTDPLGTFAGDYADSSSASVSVPSAPDELVLGVFSCETCTSVTFSGFADEQWNLIAGGGNMIGAGASVEGASPQVTINTSLGKSDHWAMGGISIKPGSMFTPTPSDTFTPTITATLTETPTPTSTSTSTLTPTDTLTPSDTPLPSDTFTPTVTATPTETPTPTNTPTATPEPGDIPYVDAVSSGATNGSSLTISHITSGLDRLMLVGVSINNDNYETVTSITNNGIPLIYVNSETQSDDARVEIWKLVDPPTGTHNVVITFSADLKRYAVGGVITFTGVDQVDPLGAFAGDNATSSSASVTIPSETGELILSVFSCETCKSVTFSYPADEQWNLSVGGGVEIGAGSIVEGVNPQLTISAPLGKRDHWAMGGISIKPAP